MTQGERLKEIRKSLGLTLEKFGESLGVKKNSMSQLENDRYSLTDQMAKSICREYNVNYDYLVYGEGEMFDDLPQTILEELCQQYNCDSFDRALIEEYLKLSEEDKQVIKKLVKNIVKNSGD